MTLPPITTVTETRNEEEVENKDPFVTTPPRKTKTQTSAPATKSEASTPLHKRFLEEVTMSPGTPTTPPRTPSRSPARNKTASKQTLEVGQNGFYFSMEIPEKKIVQSRPTSRAATPDAKAGRVTPSPEKRNGRLTPGRMTPGRLSPSPKKEIKSEVKGTPSGGGRVRDILRKNLFGTPTKKATKSGWVERDNSDAKKSPSKDGEYRSQMSGGSGSGSPMKDAATGYATALPVAQESNSFTYRSLQTTNIPPSQLQTPKTIPLTPAPVGEGAPPLNFRKTPIASTPSNIGHLMANHSNKSAKIQSLPTTGGLESMPTPLRKMSERLGLKSPHVVRKEKTNEHELKDFYAMPKARTMISPISTLGPNHIVLVKTHSSTSAPADEASETITPVTSDGANAVRKENRLTQLLPSPITVPSSTVSSRPSTATTPSYPSPLTPSRPGLSSRSKSFGTPARLRSSMQEDMFKVQESLKRSLGQEAFQKTASRPTTPTSPTPTVSRPSTSAMDRSTNTVKPTTRPLSMVGPPKPNATSTTQAVPRRPLNTAARKPRPKSMIIGSAKILESVASQIDSPRERAKLRSTAVAPSTQQRKATVPHPGTASWTSRGSSQAVTKRKPVETHPTARTTEAPAARTAVQLKRAALPSPTVVSGLPKQRVVSAEVIADRVAAWNKEDSQQTAPKPAAKLPVRSKSVKTLNKPAVKPAIRPAAKPAVERVSTPEPKNLRSDSGTAQSFTPPGLPTQLPMSPSKKLLVAPTTPVPSNKDARKQKLQNAHRTTPLNNVRNNNGRNDNVGNPNVAAQLRTPHPAATPARTLANKRHTWVDGMTEGDLNALRTPSKEIQSRLDEAIDRKIEEDRRRAGWI